MRNVFNKRNEREREPFRAKLRELLWSYHKKPLNSQQRRIIEGIRSKNIHQRDQYDKKEELRKSVKLV